MKRDFTTWLATFRDSISPYNYYTDFAKIHKNVEAIKVELNILNSLIGSKKIKQDFINLLTKYPETLKCVPILLAVRIKEKKEIFACDSEGEFIYNFTGSDQSLEQYAIFMQKTGLFDLLENHIINNLVDYVTGVETGLDSNGRKNRGGKVMESLLESYIVKAGFIKDQTYFKEMNIAKIESQFNLDLSKISNNGETVKRFDFVLHSKGTTYGIETNFYSSGGSKLNEVARSYKNIALEAQNTKDFQFVWFTDGQGWTSARQNLKETFDVMEHVYNIADLDNDILKKIIG